MATQKRRNNGQARKRKASKAGSGRGLPGWLWGLGGLAIGLFVALIVNLEMNTDREDLNNILDADQKRQEQSQDSDQDAGDDAAADQGRTDEQTADDNEPDFEFYRVLPEQEVDVPEEDRSAGATTPSEESAAEPAGEPTEPAGEDASEPPKTDESGPFVLQAGSFQDLSAADRMKAELALLGVEAQIESANLEGGETWHRVRAGPYTDRQRVNEIRRRLRDNDIDTIILGGAE